MPGNRVDPSVYFGLLIFEQAIDFQLLREVETSDSFQTVQQALDLVTLCWARRMFAKGLSKRSEAVDLTLDLHMSSAHAGKSIRRACLPAQPGIDFLVILAFVRKKTLSQQII